MRLFNKICRRGGDAFAALAPQERRRLLLDGTKTALARRVLAAGTEHYSYDGVVSFAAVPLRRYPGMWCDAVAVRCPHGGGTLLDALEEGRYASAGIFLHSGWSHGVSCWLHVDNICDDDVVIVAAAVRRACGGDGRGVL